jgi:hypothetical protein
LIIINANTLAIKITGLIGSDLKIINKIQIKHNNLEHSAKYILEIIFFCGFFATIESNKMLGK